MITFIQPSSWQILQHLTSPSSTYGFFRGGFFWFQGDHPTRFAKEPFKAQIVAEDLPFGGWKINHTELGITGLPHASHRSHTKTNFTVTKTMGVSRQTSTNIFGGFLRSEGYRVIAIGCSTRSKMFGHPQDHLESIKYLLVLRYLL